MLFLILISLRVIVSFVSLLWLVFYIVGEIPRDGESHLRPEIKFLAITWLFWTVSIFLFGVLLPFFLFGPLTVFFISTKILELLIEFSIFILPAMLISLFVGAITYIFFFRRKRIWTAAFAANLAVFFTLWIAAPHHFNEPIKQVASECASSPSALRITPFMDRVNEILLSSNNIFDGPGRTPHAYLDLPGGTYIWSYRSRKFIYNGPGTIDKSAYSCPNK
jgi:hypothetical protein